MSEKKGVARTAYFIAIGLREDTGGEDPIKVYINYMPADDRQARIFMVIYFDQRKENPRFFFQYKHRVIADQTPGSRQLVNMWGPYSFLSNCKPSQWSPKTEINMTESGKIQYNGVAQEFETPKLFGKTREKNWLKRRFKFRRDYAFLELTLGLKLVKE